MTIPKIEHVEGSRDTESITLMCTGCSEVYSYSVRQYKGDFGCNISEFEQFLRWAKWNAAQHECFLAGRVGYVVEPEDDPLTYHVDFPQEDLEKLAADGGRVAERHEDPWGGVGYVVEPLEESARELQEWLNGEDYWPSLDDDDSPDFEPDCLTCGAHSWTFVDGDCPKCNPPITEPEFDLLAIAQFERGGYWPEEFEDDPTDEESDPDIGVDDDRYDWAEVKFGFLYDEHVVTTVTGRITVHHPTIREVPRLRSFPPIEIDYASMEQRIVDKMLLDAGVYSLDNLGCLRDEKGRCLACLRPGPHLPFYWERDKR